MCIGLVYQEGVNPLDIVWPLDPCKLVGVKVEIPEPIIFTWQSDYLPEIQQYNVENTTKVRVVPTHRVTLLMWNANQSKFEGIHGPQAVLRSHWNPRYAIGFIVWNRRRPEVHSLFNGVLQRYAPQQELIQAELARWVRIGPA